MPRSIKAKAIMLFLFAWLNFSVMEVIAKHLAGSYPVLQVVWMRFSSQAFVLLIFFLPKIKIKLKSNRIFLHICRSVCLYLAANFFFIGFTNIGLANATAIYNLSPLILTLGGFFILKERIQGIKIFSVIIGVLGAIIIINPTGTNSSIYAIFPALAAVFLAIFGLITRFLGSDEDPVTSLIYTALIGTILSSIIAIWFWQPILPKHVMLILSLGLLSSFGHFLFIKAFEIEEASTLATFSSAAIVFNTIWGILIFSEMPTTTFYMGTICIVLAGLMLIKNKK